MFFILLLFPKSFLLMLLFLVVLIRDTFTTFCHPFETQALYFFFCIFSQVVTDPNFSCWADTTLACNFLRLSSKSFALIAFVELGTNPLKSSGIENGAFQGMKKLSYIRIADTNITTIPQGDENSFFFNIFCSFDILLLKKSIYLFWLEANYFIIL